MNFIMNVSNGGLVAELNNDLYICDLGGYRGTHIISKGGDLVGEFSAVMWFAAAHENGMYCSNQRNFDYLTYLDGESMEETCVQKRGCANLVMHGNALLLLDEEDGFIYEYDTAKKKSSPVVKETAFSFILVTDTIYFASESGLKSFDLNNGRTEKLEDCFPVCLNATGGQLIFSDKNQEFALCMFSISKNRLVKVDGIRTQSIVTTEEYVFASNLADNNSIVRVDQLTGEAIRFCGENAERLHIVEEYLYFLNQNDDNAWYRVSCSGGRPTPVF